MLGWDAFFLQINPHQMPAEVTGSDTLTGSEPLKCPGLLWFSGWVDLAKNNGEWYGISPRQHEILHVLTRNHGISRLVWGFYMILPAKRGGYKTSYLEISD